MHTIQLITSKGCQSTIDFRNQLEGIICKKNLDIEVKIIMVPTLKKATEMGLYGSPTILIDGLEYQKERRGPPGFY